MFNSIYISILGKYMSNTISWAKQVLDLFLTVFMVRVLRYRGIQMHQVLLDFQQYPVSLRFKSSLYDICCHKAYDVFGDVLIFINMFASMEFLSCYD